MMLGMGGMGDVKCLELILQEGWLCLYNQVFSYQLQCSDKKEADITEITEIK